MFLPVGPATREENHLYNSKALIIKESKSLGKAMQEGCLEEMVELVVKGDLGLVEATKQQFNVYCLPECFLCGEKL